MIQYKKWWYTNDLNSVYCPKANLNFEPDIKKAINLKPADKKIVKDNKMMLNFKSELFFFFGRFEF